MIPLDIFKRAAAAGNISSAQLNTNTVALEVKQFDAATGAPTAPAQVFINKDRLLEQQASLQSDMDAINALLAMFDA